MFNWFKKAEARQNNVLVERYEAALASKDKTIERLCRERDAALAAYKAEPNPLQRTIDQLTEDANLWRTQSYEADLRIAELEAELAGLKDRLNRIAAQATPGANATVKRMAAIARGDVPAQS